jgi:neutral ceramidase
MSTLQTNLRIGAAKYNITPPLDQARRLGAKGLATDVIGELCARATVFSDGKNKAAIVLLDISEFFPNITTGIRTLSSKWTDIPAENIMICATHTHSSAKVIDYDDPYDTGGVMIDYEKLSDETQAYLDMLYRYAASAVFLADSRLKPARGKIGEISVPGIGNPRVRMKDGSVEGLNVELGIKDIRQDQIESQQPFDEALRIAVFEDMEDKPICGLGNFGCHNALTQCGTTLDSDYFGWAAENIEHEMGKGFVFSLMAGAQGDVHPAGLFEHALSPDKAAAMVPVAGKMLYDGMKKIWWELEPFKVDVVSSVIKEVYFTLQQPVPIRAKNYLYGRGITGGKQDDKGVFSELQLIRIGDFAILGLCGETFNEIALNLRKASTSKHTWVGSLCNDELSYLMPAHEHKRDNESGKMNVQKEFAIPDETTEAIIYQIFKELFEQV